MTPLLLMHQEFYWQSGSTVAATGFVARPGIYELPNENDVISVGELLELTETRIIPPGLVLRLYILILPVFHRHEN